MSETVRYLDERWAACLGCSPGQLRDGGRHIVAAPEFTEPVRRAYPLRRDSIGLMTYGDGWVLSVPPRLLGRAAAVCLEMPFSAFAAEGDPSAERWYARGAREAERQALRGAGAYATLARLGEGLPIRCWSHYLHWYCDPASWDDRPIHERVRPLNQDDRQLWEQWLRWPGPFCNAKFSDGVSDAFGYVLDGRLVSVAQLQTDSEEFAWEYGVDTLPEFRRRGFATEAARAASALILKRGRVPWYYHDHYNHASEGVPRRLGYFLYAEGLFSHMR